MYVRRVRAGEFMVVNKHLVRHLSELGLWNQEVLFFTSIINFACIDIGADSRKDY